MSQHFAIEAANGVRIAEVRHVGRPDGSTSEDECIDIVRCVNLCALCDSLVEALANLAAAVEFYDKVKAAAKAGEETASTGAERDAREWLNEAAHKVAAAHKAVGDAP